MPEAHAAEFVRHTLDTVTANPALWGVTWWCSHDLEPSLADFPEREYDLGLFTVDHRPKPAAKELATIIGERRRRTEERRPALRCDVDLRTEPWRRAEVAPGSAFHTEWVRLRQTGPVAIVAGDRAADPGHLTTRGIDTVLTQE
ncbi:hypothetical protein [Nonomuraea dietziae]|uniref:hypothetical protein n=1 Tax=Nonomuraea dietziae TaxID=65515 RepID=UPI0031CF98C8